jgi:hypothetical protein
MPPRFTWRETAKGNGICESGASTAVLARQGAGDAIRSHAPGELVVCPSAYRGLELAKGEVQQRITWVAARREEMRLLELTP